MDVFLHPELTETICCKVDIGGFIEKLNFRIWEVDATSYVWATRL
jgi:hypothetical protein